LVALLVLVSSEVVELVEPPFGVFWVVVGVVVVVVGVVVVCGVVVVVVVAVVVVVVVPVSGGFTVTSNPAGAEVSFAASWT
jgi:hypothetical protein